MRKTTVRVLAETQGALDRCLEWHGIRGDYSAAIASHRRAIELVMQNAPSGAGIDSGTTLLDVTADRVRFGCSFHHMSDSGGYDGWTEHTIVVRPSFSGIDVRVTGRDRNDVKSYLADVYSTWLTSDCCEFWPIDQVSEIPIAVDTRELPLQ